MTQQPMPGDYPLTLYRGDTRVWQLTFTDRHDQPLDLSDHTFRAQIRSTAGDLLTSIDVDDSDAAEGVLTLRLSSSDAEIPVPRAAWDLELTRTSDGFVRTYLAGSVRIRGDQSR